MMGKLNSEQLGQVQRICGLLEARTGGKRDPETLGSAMCSLLPDMDPDAAADICRRMQKGVAYGRRVLEPVLSGKAGTVREALEVLTEGMSEQERKGFCLMVYEAYRQSDAKNVPEAKSALHDYQLVHRFDADGLMDLVAEQLEEHSCDTAFALTAAPATEGTDPEILAAALYVAGLRGDIPEYFAQSPEYMGVCSAASETPEGLTQEEKERLLHILLAALAAVLVVILANPAAAELSELLLQVLDNGAFHETVKSILVPIVKNNLPHLLPAAVGTATFMKINRGLNVFYEELPAEQIPEAVKQTTPISAAEKTAITQK